MNLLVIISKLYKILKNILLAAKIKHPDMIISYILMIDTLFNSIESNRIQTLMRLEIITRN